MLSSGFTNAPVSQVFFFGTIASSILVRITGANHFVYISAVPLLWKHRQLWRLFTWQICYVNSTELFFAAMTLYQLRIIERLWGSRKFASFLLTIYLPTTLLSPLLLTMLRPLTFSALSYLPAGPTALIFALLAQYHAAIPTIYKYRVVTSSSLPNTEEEGLVFSDKSFVYLLAGQLALSSFPGSAVVAAVGWLVGNAWRGEWAPATWGRWRVPGWFVGEEKAQMGEGHEASQGKLGGEGRGSWNSVDKETGEGARRRGLGRGLS